MRSKIIEYFSQISVSRGGKVLVVLWGFILAILILTPAVTIFSNGDELLGNIAFSILPSAILLNISIVIAYIVKSHSVQVVKMGWMCLSLYVVMLVMYIAGSDHINAQMEAEIVFAYSMLIMSFPVGFLAPFGVTAPDQLLDIGTLGVYTSIVFVWLFYSILGYLQWFKFVPWIMEVIVTKISKNIDGF
ncbi:MAG: hypothetical protein AB2L22_15705 [Syntrophales bacterium]